MHTIQTEALSLMMRTGHADWWYLFVIQNGDTENCYMQIIHAAAAAAVSTHLHFIRIDHLQGDQLDFLIGDDLPCEPMSFSAWTQNC